MNEEILRIQKMVAEGKITAEESVELLGSVREALQTAETTAATRSGKERGTTVLGMWAWGKITAEEGKELLQSLKVDGGVAVGPAIDQAGCGKRDARRALMCLGLAVLLLGVGAIMHGLGVGNTQRHIGDVLMLCSPLPVLVSLALWFKGRWAGRAMIYLRVRRKP